MARNKPNQSTDPTTSDAEVPAQERPDGSSLQVLNNAPVEELPVESGTMTEAAANAIKPTVNKGLSKGAQEQLAKAENGEVPKKLHYRVLADKPVNMNGSRSMMRAGKELDPSQYNIRHLRQQGVRLEAFDPVTGEAVQA